jgi:hypothetical protein
VTYKSVSWTPKNPEVLNVLQEFTGFNSYPQVFIRQRLAELGIVREKATTMVPQTNFGSVDLPLKISFYKEDHELLCAAAKAEGIKVQELLERAVLT